MPSAGKTISITFVIFLLAVSFVLYLSAHKKTVFFDSDSIDEIAVSVVNSVEEPSIAQPVEPSKVLATLEEVEDEDDDGLVREQNENITEKILLLEDRNENYPTVGDRVSTVVARRHGKAFDAEEIWQASQADTAWKRINAVPEGLNLTLEQQLDGREFIQIDPLKIESLVQGDQFEIAIAQINQSFQAIVEDVRSEDEGRSVTWSGTLLGIDPPNTFNFTRGDRLIVAGIATPQALYSLQADGEYGWIVDSATLFVGGDEPIEVTPDMTLPDSEHSDS